LQAQPRRIRQGRYRPSRLDRYTGELLSLNQAGASAAELQRWLRARRIKVVWSTVTRWLEKNREIRQRCPPGGWRDKT
ncbi:hypothetical protein, partial [Klebsiella pneumoniae]|uniref:hypothetical protein n=1 Tax=Klebsiella pneumoniae TaxID=573 RepID=UPI0027319D57